MRNRIYGSMRVGTTPRAISLAALAAAALMGAAFAAPDPLALSQAQQLAIERSPQMAAYDAAVAATRDLTVADSNANPLLRIGFARERTSPELRKALAARYEREADRTALQKGAASIDIARETALAWLDCYYVERMTRVAADQLKAAHAELDGAESMYWVGRLSQAEFYGARSMLVMLEDQSSELDHRSRAVRIALKRWVGDAGDAPLGALPNIDRIRLRSAALEGDLARHPEVALLEKQEDLAASDVRLAQANRQSEREIAVMLARRDVVRAARDEKLRAKVAEMRIMIDQWQHARDRRNRYANELVPLARERTLATLVAYRGGKASLTDTLAAGRAESEARMQSVKMEYEAARIWAQLDFALLETLPAGAGGSVREEGAR
jgi:outer membrane protein TolC